MINLSPNCIFLDGACPANFRNLYKRIIVVVDSNHGSLDPQYCHLAIRTRKTRTCIWKTKAERMGEKSPFSEDSLNALFGSVKFNAE